MNYMLTDNDFYTYYNFKTLHFIYHLLYHYIIYFKEHHFHNNNLFNTDDLMDVGHGPD